MEHSRASYGRKGINMANIIGDPFALATISIAMVRFTILDSTIFRWGQDAFANYELAD